MSAKILIADDDLDINELLKFTLESEEYTVITAYDGEEALRKTFEELPDLVVLDVNMPKLSGFEVCERIRENSGTCLIPIIILTSLHKTKDRITGIKLGADEYMSKPFEPLELAARVEALLRRTREFLSANPLTGLPGNVTIETEMKRRLRDGEQFSVIYADVDHFKSFNDKYGFERGDGIIRLIAVILRSAVTELGNHNDFLGNIGGDDFVIITTKEKVAAITDKAIRNFDDIIPLQYDENVRSRGYLWGIDRQGKETKFPLMSLSLGTVSVEPGRFSHYAQIAERAKDFLKRAKQQPGSTMVTE
jgi:diguanylate cyclase (GGDEF)-like protein